MKFPLADWIDDHARCRHNLGESGMRRVVRPEQPTPRMVREADSSLLRSLLAESVDVDPSRLFLTHGATEANGWAMVFLARRTRGTRRLCRVRFPEYPPLFDVARWAGFRISDGVAPAALAVTSNPRNPEGIRIAESALHAWAEGSQSLLVDETFREFDRSPSLREEGRRGLWRTGTFTKFFGGDELRVGYVVAPEEAAEEFAHFHGLVADGIPAYSIAGAIATWRARDRIRRRVERVWDRNQAAWRKAFPRAFELAAPVYFDRPALPNGRALADRCLRASVLVCPGELFGDGRGVRISLTRPTFPEDLMAYLAVRGRASSGHAR